MSYDGNDISLGGKDWYLSLAAIERANEEELLELRLEADLDETGDILLFSGKASSSRILYEKGISPSEWRWAIHEAENALTDSTNWSDLEAKVLSDFLTMGRRYAVARYAKWERLSYYSAYTATFSHGFRALLDQSLMSEKSIRFVEHRPKIHSSVRTADAATYLTAYHRTAIIRSAIHKSVIDTTGQTGCGLIDKNQMRNILSLARLHYSISEIRVQSVSELNDLEDLYEDDRLTARRRSTHSPSRMTRHIHNWELRHLHPLTYLYPYSIRQALHRAREHLAFQSTPPHRVTALNELALIRCQIMLMRRKKNATKIAPSQ